MKYISTKTNNEAISFKEAVINGMSNNNGLYFPQFIPKLSHSFFDNIESKSNHEIAFEVLYPFVHESLTEEQLKTIILDAINFPIPVIPINKNIFTLELFHGPTQAFKDVGARFISRCLSHFNTVETTVLVATSGDTGSAVANGFFDIPGIQVKLLFPKGRVSPYQQFQMTSLRKNIMAIEVEGTFDNCQKLVKEAFQDKTLNEKINLSSANSINIARLLPQMLYYFFAYKQLKSIIGDQQLIISVPSGNLGNITAGLLAKKMGLPIHKFIAAHNDNNTFHHYLETGKYEIIPSILTYSNAMDVSNPSNFERIDYLYHHNIDKIKNDVYSASSSNEETLNEISSCFKQNNYLLDPHGAVAKLALEKRIKKNQYGLFLETAHPQKFSEIIQKVIPSFHSKNVNLDNCYKIGMENNYEELKKLLLIN